MKSLTTLLTLCLLFTLVDLSATTYTTIKKGAFNKTATWDAEGIPPSPLPAGDKIIINHNVTLKSMDYVIGGGMTLNAKFTVKKTLTVNASGKIIGTSELKVKGDNGQIDNYGCIEVWKLHVGSDDDDDGDERKGTLNNWAGGEINVNGDLRLNGVLNNTWLMTVTGLLHNHGGIVQGNGNLLSCEVEFEENEDWPGTFAGQEICCNDGSMPIYRIEDEDTDYVGIEAFIAVNGLTSEDHAIVNVEDFIECGLTPLPAELIDFRVKENSDHHAVLSWMTESEYNNMHFVVERSPDGRDFDALGVVNGNGNTTAVQSYTFVDKLPISFAYYRLKQVDYDGNFEFSDIISFKMEAFKPKVIEAFPTIAENEITLRFTSLDNRKTLLKVINAFGSVMHEEQIYTTNELEYRTLDLSEYDHGIYHVVLTDGKEYLTKGFIVMKTY